MGGTVLDHETKPKYQFTVTARDPSNAKTSVSITVNITNIDEDPVISLNPTQNSGKIYEVNSTGDPVVYTFTHPERDDDEPLKGVDQVAKFSASDPEGATIEWLLTGTDPGAFTLEGGVLKFDGGAPNYEDPQDSDGNSMYIVTITVNDGNTANSDSVNVNVNVTNVEEDGTVSLSTRQPKVGVTITAILTDPDGPDDSAAPVAEADKDLTIAASWQWATSTDEMTWYPISSPPDMSFGRQASYTPRPSDAGMYLRATATYIDDRRRSDDIETEADESQDKKSAESDNKVQEADYQNRAPRFLDDKGSVLAETTRKVNEAASPGDEVGAPLVATDKDINNDDETLFYRLMDDPIEGETDEDAFFDILSATGKIVVAPGAMLDYEGTNTYNVVVTATDPKWR